MKDTFEEPVLDYEKEYIYAGYLRWRLCLQDHSSLFFTRRNLYSLKTNYYFINCNKSYFP